MKKTALIWIIFFWSNFIFAKDVVCLSQDSESLKRLPKSVTKNFELRENYETYSFCGSKVSAEAKGDYFVFNGIARTTIRKKEAKSYLSQIIYSPDEKIFEDVLYISEDDYYIPQISYKKIYGRDYIKFDDYGTCFINVTKHSTNKSGILMYSPIEKTKTFFALPEDFSTATDFDISENGKFLVVNGSNNGTNFSHQAFLYKTEDATAEPDALLYMLSEELSSIVFNPETQSFYMMVAFYDLKKEFDDRCGFIVLRSEKQMYRKENVQFINRRNVENGEGVDFWHNILLFNEADKNIYVSNYMDTFDSSVYRIVDKGNYIGMEANPEMEFIKLRNSIPPIYKISMKKTPLGLYLKDVNDDVYLYKDGKIIYTNEQEVNQLVKNYYENLLKENDSLSQEEQIKKLKKLVLLLAVIIGVLLISFGSFVLIYSLLKNKINKKVVQKKMLSFQEQERAKISREIHDSVVQDIRAIRLQVDMIDVCDNPKALNQKNRTIEDITQTIVKMRNICYNLTPAELMTHKDNDSAEIELISIYDSLCHQFYVKSKIPCSIHIDENLVYPKFDKEVTIHLIRVFQEILNNIEKHSYATNVNVLIRNQKENEQQYLVIFVIDDGIGCDIEQILKNHKKNHFGFANMRERMKLIDGNIDFFSAENEGMKIKLTVKM
ncbi:MAG: histidine kinase [Treponema sp.]|nr:histidine kinase [Treponema sp.]